MKLKLVLALAFAVALPACKSRPPENVQQMKKQVPDAKPTLHVAEDDPRYVASSGNATRQVHYYSVQMDTTYVVDESTGAVVRTFKSKEMPGIIIIDTPAYQPPPLKKAEKPAEGCSPAKDGCGCGCAPSEEGCGEGCAPSEEGCGCGCGETTEIEEVDGCGCDDGCGCGCGCD